MGGGGDGGFGSRAFGLYRVCVLFRVQGSVQGSLWAV